MARINANIVKTNNSKTLARDEEGLSTVEYVIILFLIAIVGIVAWRSFGGKVKEKVESAPTDVNGL